LRNPVSRRIVIDGRRLTAGRTGVGRYLELLLRQWAATELPADDVVVALAARSGLDLMPNAPGLTARVVAPVLPGLLWERFGLARMLRKGDLLFAPANLVPRSWRGSTVLVMHDAIQETRPDDFSPFTRLRFGRRYRRAIAQADRVLVPSEATAADLERVYGVGRERLVVIRPAPGPEFEPLVPEHADVKAAREAIGVGDSPFFLFAGKRSRRRNVPAVLTAFAALRDRLPEYRLVFVGDGSGRGLGDDRRPPGVMDAGHVAEPVLRGLLTSAVALLYPSEHEGFGLPVVEAMASGCPVVTLRRPALVEAGGDGPVYLEDADPAGLAATMMTLATDAEARRQRIAAGRAEVAKNSTREFANAVTRELRRAL
jgi:glycosyltransferase involved in cell wall biosynthesis